MFVYQQWAYTPRTPHGAWEFHETVIPNSPEKPLRIRMDVSDRDISHIRVGCAMAVAKEAGEKFGTGQDRQGLKPILFWFFYGPTKVVP
jgi:hypothetical protein